MSPSFLLSQGPPVGCPLQHTNPIAPLQLPQLNPSLPQVPEESVPWLQPLDLLWRGSRSPLPSKIFDWTQGPGVETATASYQNVQDMLSTLNTEKQNKDSEGAQQQPCDPSRKLHRKLLSLPWRRNAPCPLILGATGPTQNTSGYWTKYTAI